MANIAVFDFDRTIIKYGSHTPFLVYCARKIAPFRLVFSPLVVIAMIAYKLGLITRKTLKEVMFFLLIGRVNKETLAQTTKEFVPQFITKHIFTEADAAIKHHREQGDILILATASASIYTEDAIKFLDFQHLVATTMCEDDTHVLPKIQGENCYGDVKKQKVMEAIHSLNMPDAKIIFYTDDSSDMPLLAECDEGILVNPKQKFIRKAAQHPNHRIVHWD